MIPGLEEMMLAHVQQNNLTSINFGLLIVGGTNYYTSDVHYAGQFARSGIACSSGMGESVADAFGKAMDAADIDRAPLENEVAV